MAVKFILIRHGQTEWNRTERFRGHADIPLNDTGKEQARKVAAFLAEDKIDALYASPLQRAMQTAAPLAELHHLEVRPSEGLKDINFGAVEGLTVEEARQAFPEVVEKWLNAPGHTKFPKGDSVKVLKTRLEKTMEELIAAHEGQTVAFVSHRVVCHALLCLVLGLDMDALWTLKQDNACINRFEKHTNGYIVTLVNETSHLK